MDDDTATCPRPKRMAQVMRHPRSARTTGPATARNPIGPRLRSRRRQLALLAQLVIGQSRSRRPEPRRRAAHRALGQPTRLEHRDQLHVVLPGSSSASGGAAHVLSAIASCARGWYPIRRLALAGAPAVDWSPAPVRRIAGLAPLGQLGIEIDRPLRSSSSTIWCRSASRPRASPPASHARARPHGRNPRDRRAR